MSTNFLHRDELRVNFGLAMCQFTTQSQERAASNGKNTQGKKQKNKQKNAKQQPSKKGGKQPVNNKVAKLLESAEPEAPPLPKAKLEELAQVEKIAELGTGTKPLYLLDTYRFEADAEVLSVELSDDAKLPAGTCALYTDASVFHPQGGGQPSDRGAIVIRNGDQDVVFAVENVRMQPDGRICHFGRFESGGGGVPALLTVPCPAHLKVDEPYRRLCARIHSAGHIIDAAMERLTKSGDVVELPPLKAEKGYHFPDGAYVQFAGTVPAEMRDPLRETLQRHIDDLIKEKIATKMYLCTKPDELASLCFRGSWSKDQLASNGWLRVVCAGGDRGCPCGGTHIQNTAELGRMEVTKISSRKGTTKVSYKVLDARGA